MKLKNILFPFFIIFFIIPSISTQVSYCAFYEDSVDPIDQNILDNPAEFDKPPHPFKIFLENFFLNCLLKCINLHDWYIVTQKKCISYIKYGRIYSS